MIKFECRYYEYKDKNKKDILFSVWDISHSYTSSENRFKF